MKALDVQHWIDHARRQGLIVSERSANAAAIAPAPVESKADEPLRISKRELLPSCFIPPATWLIGLHTISEANDHRGIRAAMGRKASQRQAVHRELGKHLAALAPFAERFHAGEPIRVVITRLSPRQLDAACNLPRALKAIEDAVANALGADDGSPLWQCRFGQEKNDRYGVRIELAKVNG